ncbi:Olfactory receptor 4S1 [Myotis davidii]|uniref:Olfactory receptor n=2 Tax=Myotis davidii TaxID=225400 RepID=L5LCA3_MYODS|nr:Olfactory receptor 4S1 [Myotis davidii]
MPWGLISKPQGTFANHGCAIASKAEVSTFGNGFGWGDSTRASPNPLCLKVDGNPSVLWPDSLLVLLSCGGCSSLRANHFVDAQGRESMGTKNNVTEFVLFGLFQSRELQHVCFVVFSLFHMLTVLGNLMVIITINASKTLRAPMYFFLSHLSFADMCYPSATTPKMIADTFVERKTISFNGCMTQLFSAHFFGGTEIFLLTAMAYDRYVAICRPLHYVTIMDRRKCGLLAGASWVAGFFHSILQTLLTVQLPFCGPNEIDNFFCDVHPLLKLACADTYVVGLIVVANSGILSLVCFIILIVSYVVILLNLRSQSSEGRRKALSTCGSHIVTVILVLVPPMFMYIRPSTTLAADKLVILFNIVMPPLLNPLIYTLRNNEVKNAMRKVFRVKGNSGEK